jgi:AraC family transcriptional regulator of adaptative response / DNA-3-methyladenine glycosylase II
MLLSQTRLPVTDIAFASGFRSLRRFNQAFVDRYQRSPRHFRREGAFPEKGGPVLELPVLEPYDWKGMISFLARHAVPGLERVTAEGYERLLPGGGSLKVSYQKSALLVALSCSVEHMREQIERVRHLFDIDHNPAVLPPDLRGIRVPGAFDVFETAATIILSQLVSVSAARAACKKLVQTFGHPVKEASGELTHLFPTPTQLTQADIRSIGIPKARAEALRLLAVEIAEGRISLARSAPLAETRQQLLAIPGIGPWTVELIALRCLADPDAFPARDLVVARALQSNEFVPEKYSPWRAYLTLRLWQKTLNLREEKL